ncbi:hypothetical protein OS493_023469 [Desmophyllum pertusum]|uniref:Carboxylic ester hydrolase n=1 Tax=Desmophyllum pertusum TaxID=174260 RepID=A0A9W9ZMA2_9CNID|nr:hypothetical protein OS493_023469 [Desmophyllum pertusum]
MISTLLTTLSIFCVFVPLVTSVTVSTKYGDIEGLVASYPNVPTSFKSVSKFLGVPFAAPPIGKLRLKAPIPPKEWKPDVLAAKTHGNLCMQSKSFEYWHNMYSQNLSYSEDCLHLDVYTPNIGLSLPVLAYIHGGGYALGTSITYPSDILALHGVVVVVIQYRLGPLGFLTTGDSAAPGNFGMLDQVEALKWVKENIEYFGGNPSKVTIFGESAGATSVALHLLTPLSKGLFHQAIAESGVDLSPFATQPVSYGLRFAKELAQKLDCVTSDHEAMVACIREKKDTDIQKATEKINYQFYRYLRWAPVVDKNFLHDTPRNLREKGDFKKVKLMISFNSQEGGTSLGYMASSSFGMAASVDNGVSPSFFKEFVTKLAHARNSKEDNADLIADALEFMYTPWPDNSDKYALRTQLIDLIGDYNFVAPSHEVADIHSQHAPVYMYEFAHRSKNASFYPEWMGVVHAENLPYDFGIPLLPLFPAYDEADKNVSLFIMALYANFAKTGDPTPQPVSGVTWERYNSSYRAYLRVDANPKMASSFSPRRMAFWNDYHPKLAQVKFDTKKDVASGASTGVAMAIVLQIVLVIILAMF